MSVKEQYDRGMQEVRAFLKTETTWQDLTIEEFSEYSSLFKSLLLLSELVMREGVYPEEYLKEELQLIYRSIKRLVF
ncbi:hypothetical protein FZC76_20085 [Sutcliffiella horikoshii]|uniref:Uncharacterized protein n=1 Tax=Sutcliffiella horikoshii TaxID=79883 RepID=A0A5D4SK30_9BACI|nr:hypothetical protein [Sutcliffiella horikoshii]TYS63519.1 hypothetical protein FZC76_20085 [Sutcliffiella horikoshii]